MSLAELEKELACVAPSESAGPRCRERAETRLAHPDDDGTCGAPSKKQRTHAGKGGMVSASLPLIVGGACCLSHPSGSDRRRFADRTHRLGDANGMGTRHHRCGYQDQLRDPRAIGSMPTAPTKRITVVAGEFGRRHADDRSDANLRGRRPAGARVSATVLFAAGTPGGRHRRAQFADDDQRGLPQPVTRHQCQLREGTLGTGRAGVGKGRRPRPGVARCLFPGSAVGGWTANSTRRFGKFRPVSRLPRTSNGRRRLASASGGLQVAHGPRWRSAVCMR